MRLLSVVAVALVVAGCSRRAERDAGPQVDVGSRPDVPRPAVVRCGPGGECDLTVPDYCGPGRACRLVDTDGAYTSVCTTPGVAPNGAACRVTEDCAAGLHCDAHERACRPYCCDQDDCDTSNGEFCLRFLGADGVGYCQVERACSPLSHTGCGSTEGCYRLNREGAVGCLINPGTAGTGEPCAGERLGHCARGHDCTGGVCRAYCDRSTGEGCPPDHTCEPYVWAEIGICLPG